MHLNFEDEQVRCALRASWSLKTAPQWSQENPANGQCNVTAAVIHDLFGGEILRTPMPGVFHYYNQFDGQRADLSDSQFTDPGARFAAPDPYEDQPTTREAALEGIPEAEYTALRSALLAELDHYEGGCDCGTIRYRLTSGPLFVHCCHCTWCQRESGAAFALNAMIEAVRVVMLAGEPEIVDTPTISGKSQKFHRCPNCRIALWSNYAMAVGDKVRFVRVGTLDEPQRMPPDIHIFTSTKQPWLELGTKTPVHSEFYDRSELWPAESLARFAALEK